MRAIALAILFLATAPVAASDPWGPGAWLEFVKVAHILIMLGLGGSTFWCIYRDL